MAETTDTTIECRDCLTPFTMSEAERNFFTDRALSLPKRCKSCRAFRKAQRDDEAFADAARTRQA